MGYRTGETGQEGCRTGEMQDRCDTGQVSLGTGIILDRCDAGKDGFRKGGMQVVSCRTGRM